MDMIKLNLGNPPQHQIDSSSYIEHAPSKDERWLELWNGLLRTEHVESVRNLTKNWTIFFNAVQVEVSRDNSGAELYEYLYGEYNQVANLTQDKWGKYPSALGNSFNIGDRFELTHEGPFQLVSLQDSAGSIDQIREWRWNAFTSYRFDSESRLKGWSVGGGARWQDKAAIGYPMIFDNELNDNRPDINNAHFGPSELNMDSFVRYKTRIFGDKVDMTLTLNIRNLFDEDDLIPVAANPNSAAGHPSGNTPGSRGWSK